LSRISLLLVVLIACAWLPGIATAALTPAPSASPLASAQPLKINSYICLRASKAQNMCLGFSPGSTIKDFVGKSFFGLRLQIKNRAKNFAKESEYKTKWDVNRESGVIKASAFSDLCMVHHVNLEVAANRAVVVGPCHANVTSDASVGPWNVSQFLSTLDEAGMIRSAGTNLCATVMGCAKVKAKDASRGYNCASDNTAPMLDAQVVASGASAYGTYVRLALCDAQLLAQQWVQALDCASGSVALACVHIYVCVRARANVPGFAADVRL